MPALTNPKHEKFAQGVAVGIGATQAYISAGYEEKAAYAAASRLLSNVKVKARIMEIQKPVEEKAIDVSGITKAWVMQALRNNHDKAIESGAGNVANRALELLGKEIGMFVDRVKDVTTDVEGIPDEKLLEWREKAAAVKPSVESVQ